MANKTMRKVIIDTDPGIDDAMALMMALQAHDRGKQNSRIASALNLNGTFL